MTKTELINELKAKERYNFISGFWLGVLWYLYRRGKLQLGTLRKKLGLQNN